MSSRVTGYLLALTIILLGAAACTVSSPQTQSPLMQPTPTVWTSFAQAEIAKPTYTPLPAPTATPTLLPTVTPEAVSQVQAVIVDTSISNSVETQAQAPANYTGGKYI